MSRRRLLRLALPTKGRLHAAGACELARDAGIQFETNGRALHLYCPRWELELLLARSDDIPVWAGDGAVEAAIAGRNQSSNPGQPRRSCWRWASAPARSGWPWRTLRRGVRGRPPGAGSPPRYPVTTAGSFADRRRRGQVVADPRLGRAGAAAGRRRRHRRPGVERRHAALERSASDRDACSSPRRCCSRGPAWTPIRRIASELATVIQSVVVARGRRYVMLNAPDERSKPSSNCSRGSTPPPCCRWRLTVCTRCTRSSPAAGGRPAGPAASGRRALDPRASNRQPDPVSIIRPELADAEPYRWQEGLPTDRPLHRFDMNTRPLPPSWYARAQARLSRVVVQTYPDATYSRLRSLLSESTPATRPS